jgi:hypothetical protein
LSERIRISVRAWGLTLVLVLYTGVFIYMLKKSKFAGTKPFLGYFCLIAGQCIAAIVENALFEK